MSKKALSALLLIAFLPLSAFCAEKIQRYLVSLRLGDTLEDIRVIYPPKREWKKFKEPNGGLDRILIEKGESKWFPTSVETVRLGMREGKLIHLQLIYNKKYSRGKSVGELVVDLSLIYGEPRRYGDLYFWWDRETVLAVSNAHLKTGRGKELRTSLELMEKGHFEPFRK